MKWRVVVPAHAAVAAVSHVTGKTGSVVLVLLVKAAALPTLTSFQSVALNRLREFSVSEFTD